MKKVITFFVGLALIASLATGAFAQAAGPKGSGVQSGDKQGQKGPRDGKGRGILQGKMLKELELTKEQLKQVKEIMQKAREKRMSDPNVNAKVDRKEMMARRQALMAEVEKILTPEQKEKLKKLQAAGKDKIKDRIKNGKRGVDPTGKGGGATGAGSKTGAGGGGL
jgi:Spy/CpxP family protein refolding chaperone